jgi:hypothetical protein
MSRRWPERYGEVEVWSREFDIPTPTLRARLRDVIPLTSPRGPESDFYSESDVRRVCADLVRER